MIKQKIKLILSGLLTVIMIMSLTTPLFAVATNPENNQTLDNIENILSNINDRLDNQMSEIDRLRRLLEDGHQSPQPPPQPTPAPTFEPIPVLLSPQSISLEAGQTQDITITIRNIGTHTASNLLTQAASDGPFTIQFLNNSNSINSIASNRDVNMTMRITVDANVAPGSHTITLNHFFRDQARENLSRDGDRINVRIGGAVGTPNVRVGNFRFGGVIATPIEPNQNFTVTANIENVGLGSARDVQVRFPDLDTKMVFFTGDPNQAFFATLDSDESRTVNFQFQTANRIDDGMHTVSIPFEVTFRDENGENPQTETFTFPVNIYSPEDDTLPNLEIRNMSAPSGLVNVNQTGTISFYLYNAGEADARNILVVATPESTSDIVPVVTANRQAVPMLAPGESRLLTFSFSPRESASTRSYAIGFNVSFEEGRGTDTTAHTFEQFAAINVYNPDEEDDEDRIQIPRIIVSSYTVYPRIPLAGQTFEMEITFQNTNATRSVNNIVITLEALEAVRDQGTVFSPAEGSNTMFIDYIPPRGEVTRTISWFTVPDASPRSYPLRVRFVYQDQDFREHTAEENLNINVQQVVRLDLQGLSIPSNVMQGSGIWLDLQIANTGMVTLRNLRVRVDGPFDTSESDMFIGNVSPGSFRSYTGSIIPLESGRVTGAFVVYGEDATGATVEFPTEFTVEVTGGDDMGFGDRDFMFGDDDWFEGGGMIWDGEGGFVPSDPWGDDGDFDILALIRQSVIWVAIGGIVFVAIVVTIVIVVRKKRNRLDFDDDL